VPRLALPGVTLCAATSINVEATICALQECLRRVDFAECLLFTDTAVTGLDPRIRLIPIEHMHSGASYSVFILRGMVDHISSPHALVVQWDGFVIDPAQWDSGFLEFDYIGAPWPQFTDGRDVGNGGFSLRSRRLLEACRDPDFHISHPEDVAICRLNRDLLERDYEIRFADRPAAERFAFERARPDNRTFGFHGVFNMVSVLGPDRFWQIYGTLDDKRTILVDYRRLMRQVGNGRGAMKRRTRLTLDRIRASFSR
jgi:hypothetical protein